jgi:drug/metabolite transporter (DMT)-like permease
VPKQECGNETGLEITLDRRETPKPDNLRLAIWAILFAVFALSLGDAVIKLISHSFVVWQVFVLRSVLLIPILALWVVYRDGVAGLRFVTPFWTGLRSAALVLMWLLYYVSLPYLELSIAAAAFYTLPLFITLFSAAFSGDRVGRMGWLAVCLGFVGVLLILRPDAGDFNFYALLPLGSAMLYAVAMILTRTKCQDEKPIMLSMGMNLVFVMVGGLATLWISGMDPTERSGRLLAPWMVMDSAGWATMGLLALAVLIGSLGAAIAYQKAPPATVGTFDFAYVGFAVIWGGVFFAEIPDVLSVAGMVLIVVAGIVSVRRSRVLPSNAPHSRPAI